MKICKKCFIQKPLAEFGNDKTRKDGKYAYCKNCTKNLAQVNYQKNKNQILYQAAQYRNKNRAKIRQYHSVYYRKNTAKQKQAIKNWQARNKDKIYGYIAKRRSLIGNSVFLVTQKEIEKLLSQTCCYCQTNPSDSIEHIIPLSRGGSHGIGNLAGACKSCNSSKKDKTIMEFRLWKSNQIVTKIS